MHMTKHAAVVLSTTPGDVTRPPPDPEPVARRRILERHDGDAVIAAYTVHHGRDGAATDAVAVCDVVGTTDGARCYAASRDGELLAALETDEWVGRTVRLADGGEGVNLMAPV
jgi:acetyl-CoA C-acetyltransferase